MIKIIFSLLILVFVSCPPLYCIGATNSEGIEDDFTIATNHEPTTLHLRSWYTQVFIPSHIDISTHHIRLGDWISIIFIRNEGRPMLYDNENHFVPLACAYQINSTTTSRNHPSPLTFIGCYNGVSALPRTDAVDPVFIEGSEVFQASRIITQTIRGDGIIPSVQDIRNRGNDDDDENNNRGNHLLTASVPIAKYEFTYADSLTSNYDLLNQIPGKETVPLTPQAKNLNIYFQAFPEPTNLAPIFDTMAPLISFEVVDLANYTGRPAVFGYQSLVDFSVSDSVRIDQLIIERWSQSGHVIRAEVAYDSSLPHNVPALQIWYNKYMVEVEFDRYGKLYHVTQVVDLWAAIMRRPPASSLNITNICNIIQTHCTADVVLDQFDVTNQPPNSVDPYHGGIQYSSVDDCHAYVSTLPLQSPQYPIATAGGTVACIEWHATLAIATPQHHCLHSGKLNLGPLLTPCHGY